MQKQEKKEIQKKNKFKKQKHSFKLKNKKYKFLPKPKKLKRLKLKNFKRPFKVYKNFINQAYAHIYIVTKPNNIFFGFHNNKQPKKTLILSSSSLKQKITKKRIKKNLLPNITKFLAILEKGKFLVHFNFALMSLILPKNLKKKVLRHIKKTFLKKFLRKKKFLLNVKSLKVFNGCTPKKQRKKKRKGFRVLK